MEDNGQDISDQDLQVCIKVLKHIEWNGGICEMRQSKYDELRGCIYRLFNTSGNPHADKKMRKKKRKLRDMEKSKKSTIVQQVGVDQAMKKRPKIQFETVKDSIPTHSESEDEDTVLECSHKCYVCKSSFVELHHFYHRLCKTCAETNYNKRVDACPYMEGKIAIVTGGRVKIGYETALRLLRNGATVVVTSRFPMNALERYEKELDYDVWKSKLFIYGLDMLSLDDIQTFIGYMKKSFKRIDIFVNNAAQTIRRPFEFYKHLIEGERSFSLLEGSSSLTIVSPWKEATALYMQKDVSEKQSPPLLQSSLKEVSMLFPDGVYDEHGQQVDLRVQNSWTMKHTDVSEQELAEVHIINSIAPYILCSGLFDVMKTDVNISTFKTSDYRFIINVSSVEGQFYHVKNTTHPHTNMAKASLNMMTRTSAPHFAKHGILMNSVDTGWVSDMLPKSEHEKYKPSFVPPLDCIDGAARITDPIFNTLNGKESKVTFGKFLKDYNVSPW